VSAAQRRAFVALADEARFARNLLPHQAMTTPFEPSAIYVRVLYATIVAFLTESLDRLEPTPAR
jgi:hypothetical protein